MNILSKGAIVDTYGNDSVIRQEAFVTHVVPAEQNILIIVDSRAVRHYENNKKSVGRENVRSICL
jgi:hypothetical protein